MKLQDLPQAAGNLMWYYGKKLAVPWYHIEKLRKNKGFRRYAFLRSR